MSKINNYLKMIVTTMICFAMNMVPEKFLSVFSGIGQAVAAHKKRYSIAGKSYIMESATKNKQLKKTLQLSSIESKSIPLFKTYIYNTDLTISPDPHGRSPDTGTGCNNIGHRIFLQKPPGIFPHSFYCQVAGK